MVWKFWWPDKSPRWPWHFVEHLACLARIGIVLSLLCEPDPLTQPSCPLGLVHSRKPHCYFVAAPKPCSMPWHFAERVACVLRARAERANCSRVPGSPRRTYPVPWSFLARGTKPRPCPIARDTLPPLSPYSAAAASLLAARRRRQPATAQVGTAPTTPARQLPFAPRSLIRMLVR